MQHAVDIDFRNRATRHAGKQYAPQGIAQRVAEAALKRLDNNASLVICM
jgi:hypothetical protein